MKIQLLFLAIFLILQVSTGCKKDAFLLKSLEGKWEKSNKWDDGYTFHEDRNFKADGTVEIIVSIVDLNANITKGYLNREIGTYTLKGDSVIYSNLKLYSTNTGSYKKLEELEYVKTYVRLSQKLSFNSNKNELTLTYAPCSDTGFCYVGSHKYFKIN